MKVKESPERTLESIHQIDHRYAMVKARECGHSMVAFTDHAEAIQERGTMFCPLCPSVEVEIS